jgi:hypothetical protein
MKGQNMKQGIIITLTAAALAGFAMSFGTRDRFAQEQTFTYRKVANSAFKPGEKLTFRAHYGIINAGIITMSVGSTTTKVGNRNAYSMKVEGETLKTFDWAYKVRDKFESWVDDQSLAPLRYAKTVREDKYFDEDLAIYMHDKKKMRNSDGELAIPVYTQDIASALYYARNLDLKNAKLNQSFPIDVYLDNKVYNLSFTYIGKETIKTDLGKVRCIKLRPKLVVDRVFKNTNDMTVWVSDDDNKIPIRVQTEIKVGSIKVDITGYQNLKNSFTALVVK